MDEPSSTARILLVEDNKDFAKLVQVYLQRFERDKFAVVWKENYSDTMELLKTDSRFDIILMDYFLPGKNGLEIARELLGQKIGIPIVFLTVNKDFDLAVDVMKLGVDDYLVKEEISSPVLPKTILSVIEKHRLQNQLVELEASRQRLRAVREMLANIMHEFEVPLAEMKILAAACREKFQGADVRSYSKYIDENVTRIISKLEKLKTLQAYKTIKYIKDIKMIDLS
jgi:DNA-binding response OmpR family regulator